VINGLFCVKIEEGFHKTFIKTEIKSFGGSEFPVSQKLAIDFGTTNSVIALWDEKSSTGQSIDIPPLSLSTGSGAFLIPSLLYVKNGQAGEIVIGQEVRRRGLDLQPGNRLFRNFKRTIGAESILESRIIDGAPWTEEQAGQAFLQHLLDSLPYRTEEIEQLVITVPVAAFEGYIAWLNRSLEGFPAGKIRIVDESTAAALGYAVTEPGAIVMVIDFGGGTLDLSLVRLPESREKTGKVLFTDYKEQGGEKARVIAKVGVSLGGSDIDQWILQEMLRRENLPSGALGAGYSGLLSACENAKIELSGSETATVEHSNIRQSFSRSELEALMAANGFYTALKQSLEKVMGLAHQKGVYREDIRHVLMIGGTSLIPSVQRTLDDFFRSITQRKRKSITQMPTWPAATWSIENTSIRVDKPFTAVVEGALQVSAGFGLDDQLAHGYGLRFIDETGKPLFDEIIPMGSNAPSRKPVSVVLSASCAGQEAVEFVIGQIDTDAVTSVEVKYEGGQAYFVAQAGENARKIVPLNAGQPRTVKLSPPGQPGIKRLRAEFRVDSMRQLRLTVTDLKTHKTLLADAVAVALRPTTLPPEGDGEIAASPDGNGITGREPSLPKREKAGFQLSLRGLASMLNLLPPDQISVEAYAAALRSDDCMVRFNAADNLARRGDRDARLVFEDVLQNGTPHQRASAAGHLYRFSWFAAEPLYRRALSDDDQRVREAAVFSLCKMRLPEAYALVTEILTSGSDAMRLAAVWGLYSRPDPAAVPVLEVALRADNPEIRELALEVLGATENPAGIPVVKAALHDPSPDVQYAATLSWVELAREACFAELADLISRTRGLERRSILRGFFHATNYMGIETGSAPDIAIVIRALNVALEDDLPETRLSAFLPLCWIRHPEAETALLEGFHREKNSDVKARMLTTAVNLMSPVADRLLTDSLSDPDPLMRQTTEHLSRNK
jgi:molecular chaperone DnaK (HSP70)/HEAT repeat protein